MNDADSVRGKEGGRERAFDDCVGGLHCSRPGRDSSMDNPWRHQHTPPHALNDACPAPLRTG